MYIDTHIHTREYSADATLSIDDLIAYAQANQPVILGTTEHYDYDYPDKENQLIFDPEKYHLDFSENKMRYEERYGLPFPILSGIECGYLEHLGSTFDSFSRLYPFDSVICSAHYFDGFDPYFDRRVYKLGKDKVYSRYLEIIIHSLENFSDFDIVGHYDYICRFAPYEDKRMYYKDFSPLFDRIFSLCIKGGKALELNTKTSAGFLSENMTDYLFDPAILLRYREMGGQMVSFGSDAHTLGSVMTLFDETRKLLKDSGFTRIVYFKNRLPAYIQI